MMIAFDKPPSIGTVIRFDAQEFELVSERDHVRKDGLPSKVLTWISACPTCGDQFEQTSGLASNGWTRRCATCRRAGKPVKGKRGRKIKIEIVEP